MKRIFRENEVSQLLEEIYEGNVVLTGGHFNPLHVGHVNLLQESSIYGDILVVAVNGDHAAMLKNGFSFMPIEHRLIIVSALDCVDFVIENNDATMEKLIYQIKPQVYTKGGDVTEENLYVDERKACEDCGTRIYYNVGGSKMCSSSQLVKKGKIVSEFDQLLKVFNGEN